MTGPAMAAGGCLCGAVRYELAAAPRKASCCHCSMCRRASGGAFQAYASVPRDALRWTRGEPKVYRSSPHASRGFCAECGSPLVFVYDPKPHRIAVAVGSLDKPELAAPAEHWGVESWLPWLKIDDGLPRRRTEDDPEFAVAREWAKRKA
jgi:hypothetical protein